MNKNCGIYKITSPTGRIYIGESKDIKRRWQKYNLLNCNGQPKLLNSFKKHGVENHQFDIIEYCEVEQLNCSERFWQDEFNVLGENGLNCSLTNCGDKKYVHSEETKKKLSERQVGEKNHMFGKKGELHHSFGKSMSEEAKQKMSKSRKGRFVGKNSPLYGIPKPKEQVKKAVESRKGKYLGSNNARFGTKLSEETKQKISKVRLEKNFSGGKSPVSVLVMCLQTGIFYDCIKDASEAYNIKYDRLKYLLRIKSNKISLTRC